MGYIHGDFLHSSSKTGRKPSIRRGLLTVSHANATLRKRAVLKLKNGCGEGEWVEGFGKPI